MASKKKNVVKASKQNLHIVARVHVVKRFIVIAGQAGIVTIHKVTCPMRRERLKAHGVSASGCVDVQAEYTATDSFTGLQTELAEFVFRKDLA